MFANISQRAYSEKFPEMTVVVVNWRIQDVWLFSVKNEQKGSVHTCVFVLCVHGMHLREHIVYFYFKAGRLSPQVRSLGSGIKDEAACRYTSLKRLWSV